MDDDLLDDPDNLDDLLERLPGNLRRKVAGHLNGRDTGTIPSHDTLLAEARERLERLRGSAPVAPYVDTFVDPEPHREWAQNLFADLLD